MRRWNAKYLGDFFIPWHVVCADNVEFDIFDHFMLKKTKIKPEDDI